MFITDQLLQYAKSHPYITIVNFLLSMTFPLDDILIPFLFGKLVDTVSSRRPFGTLLVALLAVLFLSKVMYIVTSWHDAYFLPGLQNSIRVNMIKDILEKFQSISAELQVGEIMSRFVKVPINVIWFVERLKNYLIPYLISFLLTSAYAISIDSRLGLALFAAGIIVYYIVFYSPKVCYDVSSSQETSIAKLDDFTEDILRNIATVYTSNQVSKEISNLEDLGAKYTLGYCKTTNCTVYTRVLATIVLGALLIYFAMRSSYMIKKRKMTAGAFAAIFTILVHWFGILGWLSGEIRDIVIEWGVLSSHDKFLAQNSIASSSSLSPSKDIAPNHVIEVKGLTYTTPSRKQPILDNINFVINSGERVAIIGDIGSGKSTLLKLLARLKSRTDGAIYIYGKDIQTVPNDIFNKVVGYVQQHASLFDRSILDNITYGIPNADHVKVIQLIKQVGLDTAFSNLESGINTRVGKGGSLLSGGQRQLVQLMRIMLLDPEILLLDEITASLDLESKKRVAELLQVIMKDRTVVMVTHDPFLMGLATRFIGLKEGRITDR